jgi:hypothetical protein
METKLNQIGRRFALSEIRGVGVSCSEDGVFVGSVPLLSNRSANEADQWQPPGAPDLNRELGKYYGLPVEFDSKMAGLATVAQALNRGDLLHAQIATLHLQIPDPPRLTKAPRSAEDVIDLARQLSASGLLRADWDPTKHPRWPSGSPDSTGGQFAPVGTATEGPATQEPNAPVIPAQITIPLPPIEIPGELPFPREIVPPPIAIPDTYPRELKNPYPDRAGCDEEWAEAIKYCDDLRRRGQLRTDKYRGMGDYYQCVMGNVSQRCGGFSTGA